MNLKQLSSDKFAPAFLLGKTVNICDDERITSNKIDTEVIKSILSEGWVNGQIKYGQPFDFRPVATFLIGTNFGIDLDDTTDAIERRFIVIPMKAKFSKANGNLNVNMFEQLKTKENLEYIIYKAMHLFAQVLKLGYFPIPKEVENETNAQLLENNSVKQFVLDNPFRREKPTELYEKYVDYCKESGLDPIGPKTFGTIIKNTDFNGVEYVKRKLSDPEDGGKQKPFYVTKDYNSKETPNPMISRYGNDFFNDLITTIKSHKLDRDDFELLKEIIDDEYFNYPSLELNVDIDLDSF